MERMPDFKPMRSPDVNNSLRLEDELGVELSNLDRYFYSPLQDAFKDASDSRAEPARDQIEVLFHPETSTLVVRPPSPKSITMDDLAAMALPVVRFIEDQQPDIVIGCDRGARIYAVAVHSMWGKLFRSDKERFPTLDGDMHFARLSTSLDLEVSTQAIKQIVKTSQKEAKKRGKKINGKKPKIMFIDDLVASGRTRKHIFNSLDELALLDKVDVSFAIMCGPGADVSGSRYQTEIPWHDNPRVIGVNYGKDGVPFAVRTEEARQVRRKVHAATRKLASKMA